MSVSELGSIIDINNIDARIERVKRKIEELKNPERAIKNLEIELDFLNEVRKCASRKILAR